MTNTEQNILKEKMIKKVIKSFDTSERKAKDCNVMMERFKSNYSLSEMEHCAEDIFNESIQLAQKETAEKIEKLKEELPKAYTLKCAFKIIDRIFKEKTE